MVDTKVFKVNELNRSFNKKLNRKIQNDLHELLNTADRFINVDKETKILVDKILTAYKETFITEKEI